MCTFSLLKSLEVNEQITSILVSTVGPLAKKLAMSCDNAPTVAKHSFLLRMQLLHTDFTVEP